MGNGGEVFVMYCQNCGEKIDDKAVVCPKCGVPVKKIAVLYDAPNTGFAALGFFFPLVGLILYLVWKDDMPLRAYSVGKGALIGLVVSIIFSIIACYVVIAVGAGCGTT